jgi:thioredoxin 1
MIIRDNVVLYAQPGALPAPALEELITKARELNMDEIRASIAEREGASVAEREGAGVAEREGASQTDSA